MANQPYTYPTKHTTRHFIMGLLLNAFLLFSCRYDEVRENGIEFWTIKNYVRASNVCRIISNDFDKDVLILNDSGIVFYRSIDYTFVLTETAKKRMWNLPDWTAFCLTVDNEIIYTGFIKPGYSSSSCAESIVIDPLNPGNSLRISLGYPVQSLTFNYPDNRNDVRLLTKLEQQGKLK